MDENEVITIIHKKLSFFPSLTNKRKAILRRNLLTEIKHPLQTELEELDLYDNKINSTKGLESFPNLKILDISFNLLKQNNLPNFVNLTELYFIANDIEEISFMNLPNLIKLDMAENSLKEIVNVNHFTKLKELYLGNNFITQINNLPDSLEVLDLQCNPIKKIDCKDLPKGLKTLMLNDANELECIINLECLTSLEFLGVLRTKIDKSKIEEKTKAEVWI
ncbi:leucine repeat-rich protein [Tubulinosema ratisbonensis]|uniref:Leucine repeat-rich protein n=1 Tax=Tubulinosema ratisbonensis TaxID=291195 RepID=A0A437APA6_9MICR|nr:leucine repeat-rich protein [Tubulinosema ratisbonensis]